MTVLRAPQWALDIIERLNNIPSIISLSEALAVARRDIEGYRAKQAMLVKELARAERANRELEALVVSKFKAQGSTFRSD